jgi:hypothetical protein
VTKRTIYAGTLRDEKVVANPAAPASSIDAFAPSFSSFIDERNSGFLGRDCYMNNGLRQAYEPESDDADLGEHSRLEHHAAAPPCVILLHAAATKVVASACLSAKARIRPAVPPVVGRASGELNRFDVATCGTLDRGIVTGSSQNPTRMASHWSNCTHV